MPAPITRPVHTAWHGFQRLPSDILAAAKAAPAGSWRLASYLTSTGWQGTTAGPPPGLLTCPTVSTCYVTASTAAQPTAENSLYVTTDGTRERRGSAWPWSRPTISSRRKTRRARRS